MQKSSINLLEIIGATIVGGMEIYVLRLLERLPKEKFKITCLCSSESNFTSRLRNSGCTVHITPLSEDPDWQAIQVGLSIIRLAKIDIIHTHLSNAHTLGGILSKLTQVPALATIHGRYIGIRDLEVHKLLGTHIHVVAKTAYFYSLNLGISVDKISFIANGVDTEIFKSNVKTDYIHTKIDIPSNKCLVGFIGRLSPEKGPDIFVKIAIQVVKQLPDCHFVLVGEGPMRDILENEINSKDCKSNIHLLGLQNDMPAIYSSLDLIVSTSYTEGMPLAVLEAMSSSLPVIATNVGGLIDIVEIGSNGYLNNVGDYSGMTNNIITLIVNEQLRVNFGKSARARMIEKFNLEEKVNETNQLLCSLLSTTSNKKVSKLVTYANNN